MREAEVLKLAARIDNYSSKDVVSFFIPMHNEPLFVGMRVNDADLGTKRATQWGSARWCLCYST